MIEDNKHELCRDDGKIIIDKENVHVLCEVTISKRKIVNLKVSLYLRAQFVGQGLSLLILDIVFLRLKATSSDDTKCMEELLLYAKGMPEIYGFGKVLELRSVFVLDFRVWLF